MAGMRRILLTGFKPFLDNATNPSGLLSQALGGVVLDVSYQAVDCFLESVDFPSFDFVLCLGLHAGITRPQIERRAYNEKTRKHPDADGVIPEDTRIEKDGPETRETRIDVDALCQVLPYARSEDPGRYLCNYIYYKALGKTGGRALFVHLPPPSKEWPLEKMKSTLETLISLLPDKKA